ncbi:hypothetical protein QJS10_CPB15g00283 [Acorus calamus]|uniref:Uncharacterized protein n=1 Tax=Acorus calamus TaxID=4465 RepID=A0AAV9D8I8_ACOCL|nr:hypothetical protein QJS10_CPB15g00283 [Acorus calamus]
MDEGDGGDRRPKSNSDDKPRERDGEDMNPPPEEGAEDKSVSNEAGDSNPTEDDHSDDKGDPEMPTPLVAVFSSEAGASATPKKNKKQAQRGSTINVTTSTPKAKRGCESRLLNTGAWVFVAIVRGTGPTALFGHMRSHPEQSWRGIVPPADARRVPDNPSPDMGAPPTPTVEDEEIGICKFMLLYPDEQAVAFDEQMALEEPAMVGELAAEGREGETDALRSSTQSEEESANNRANDDTKNRCSSCQRAFPSGLVLHRCEKVSEDGSGSSATKCCDLDLNLPPPPDNDDPPANSLSDLQLEK